MAKFGIPVKGRIREIQGPDSPNTVRSLPDSFSLIHNSQRTERIVPALSESEEEEINRLFLYFKNNPENLRDLIKELHRQFLLLNKNRNFKYRKQQFRIFILEKSLKSLARILAPAFLSLTIQDTSGTFMDGMRPGYYKQEFQEEEKIAAGAFGEVFKAIYKVDKQSYAVKKIPFNIQKVKAQKKIMREVICLAKLDNANVVGYKTSWMETEEGPLHGLAGSTSYTESEDTDQTTSVTRNLSVPSSNVLGSRGVLYIQMELCDESLSDWLEKRNSYCGKEVDMEKAFFVFKRIVKGVSYLHSLKIIHRDLKPKNILFKDNKPKIADFGLAFLESNVGDSGPANPSQGVGTLLYAAPEQKESNTYNEKVDIYALGVILIQLIYPFITESQICLCLHRLKMNAKCEELNHIPQLKKRYIQRLLHGDPKVRPSADDILESCLNSTSKKLITKKIGMVKNQNRAKMRKLTEENQKLKIENMNYSWRLNVMASQIRQLTTSPKLKEPSVAFFGV